MGLEASARRLQSAGCMSAAHPRLSVCVPHTIAHSTVGTTRICCCTLQDATDLVARLRAFHHTAQSQPDKKNLSQCGLDLINGKVSAASSRQQPLLLENHLCWYFSQKCLGQTWPWKDFGGCA